MKLVISLIFLFCSVLSCSTNSSKKQVSSQAPQDWRSYNNDLNGRRFASVDQINKQNVANLKEQCRVQLGDDGAFHSGLLVIRRTLYVATAHTTVAMDATNCHVLWHHRYTPGQKEVYPVDRGVAYWNGKVFRGTGDARLLALDAQTGKEVWNKKIGDPTVGEFTSAAPIAWNNLIFIGPAGGDWGIRGRMCAYSADDGSQVWCFHTIPMGKEQGAETWHVPESAKRGGGATWTSYSLDPDTGELFIPVGNPAPDFASQERPGENLFTDSVLVLDAKTGGLKWYYQLQANDALDYDLAAPPLIHNVKSGEQRVTFGGKDGYLYSLERGSHKLVYKVPVTTIENSGAKPTKQGVHVCPGWLGGVEWNGPSYDPARDMVVVGTVDWCGTYKLGPAKYKKGDLYVGTAWLPASNDKPLGWVHGIDAKTGQVMWAYHADAPVVAGVTPTSAGIVFTGDLTGNLLAFDTENGKLLLKKDLGGAIAGGVITYAVDQQQYVASTAGNISRSTFQTTGSPAVVILKTGLDADQKQVVDLRESEPVQEVEGQNRQSGQKIFQQFCAGCHGKSGEGGTGPSLLGESKRRSLPEIIEWVKNPKKPMPKLYPAPLNNAEVAAVSKYVAGL